LQNNVFLVELRRRSIRRKVFVPLVLKEPAEDIKHNGFKNEKLLDTFFNGGMMEVYESKHYTNSIS
jgi:hypothetical protein